jgi:CRISPR/Cas system-associated protein Cas10 (large subunit of type III CRISPR-Cas system)
MIKLPVWVREIFGQSVCPFKTCQKKLTEENVIAVGIRNEESKEDGEILSFFYEYRCPHCGKRSVFTGFPTSMEDFISDLIDLNDEDEEDDEEMEVPGEKKSKISSAEIDAARKLLRKSKNYKEFMGYFGINDVEPEQPDERKDQ